VWYGDLQKHFVTDKDISLKQTKNLITALFQGEDWESLLKLKEEKDDDSVPVVEVKFDTEGKVPNLTDEEKTTKSP